MSNTTNIKIKRIFSYWLLVVLVFIGSILAKPAQAQYQTMSNDLYILQLGNFNTIAGTSAGGNAKLNITVGQVSPGLYLGTNFKVRAGFQYISSIIPFSFSIDQTLIDFGTLTPTNPVLRNNLLTVSNQSAGGYNVTAYETRQMTTNTGAVIPDTTCDSGTCNETTPGSWTSQLTYGFGYRCDGITGSYCPVGFANKTNYAQFADKSATESAQIVMTGKSGRKQQAKITYKINIAGSQAVGSYTNQLVYIATPTF